MRFTAVANGCHVVPLGVVDGLVPRREQRARVADDAVVAVLVLEHNGAFLGTRTGQELHPLSGLPVTIVDHRLTAGAFVAEAVDGHIIAVGQSTCPEVGCQVGGDVCVAIVPDGEEDAVLIGRRNRVGVLTILVWHRLSAHLYAHVAARDAQRHEVRVNGGPLLGHEHLLVAPLVRLVLRRIWSRGVSEPKVCGRCGEAAQMGIDDGTAARALEVELYEARDAVVALWSLYLDAIPRVGREVHLRDDFHIDGLAPGASLGDTVSEEHLVRLTILDKDIEGDVACHLGLQPGRSRNGGSGNAEAIDKGDAVVGLEGGEAFRLAVSGVATLYLAVVAVAIDNVRGLHLQDAQQRQHSKGNAMFHGLLC